MKKADFVDSSKGSKLILENKRLTLDEASLPGPVREACLPAPEEFIRLYTLRVLGWMSAKALLFLVCISSGMH